ncbi:MAG: lytic transglycosylase domain-containing protein [Alphaproteobacteria bacterium]|nr:lytic transglycosylase domain-containing protein [Alphaproteobacteria bacterium]
MTMRADAALRANALADQAMCQLVGEAAATAAVPEALLTRLLWVESRFRLNATSPTGAQGVAQFMPQTALDRGLADPFEPGQAIPNAARLLADLDLRFGNFGLAAAAYNAGAARVAAWLAGSGTLPVETRGYVLAVTGRVAEDWALDRERGVRSAERPNRGSCLELAAELRSTTHHEFTMAVAAVPALRLNPLDAAAMVSFDRARRHLCGRLGGAAAISGGLRGWRIPPLCVLHASRNG